MLIRSCSRSRSRSSSSSYNHDCSESQSAEAEDERNEGAECDEHRQQSHARVVALVRVGDLRLACHLAPIAVGNSVGSTQLRTLHGNNQPEGWCLSLIIMYVAIPKHLFSMMNFNELQLNLAFKSHSQHLWLTTEWHIEANQRVTRALYTRHGAGNYRTSTTNIIDWYSKIQHTNYTTKLFMHLDLQVKNAKSYYNLWPTVSELILGCTK